MYLKFYSLRDEPFGVTPDPRFLYLSPTYREAQATLEYGIRSGRGFTALVAKPGMGKTTLLFHLLEQYSGRARTAFIFLTQCDSREFMRYLMSELGASTEETDFVRLQDQFGQLLLREAQAGKKVIAVVDEAQNLDVNVLETVRLLSDFETPRFKLLHIILTGQPELADKLTSPALLQLRQRISHLVRLEPLSEAQVRQYIEHRLRVAGYVGPPLFTAEAQALIVQRSEGIPRLINNLCFNALSLGCALGRRTIDAAILAEVSADMDFEALAREKQNGEAPAATVQEAAARMHVDSSNGAAGTSASEQAAPAPLETSAAASTAFEREPAILAPPPGPVLVPPAQAPATVARREETPAEIGNLALQMEPNGATAQPALAAEAAVFPANGLAAAPSNGSAPAPNGADEKGNPIVDVDAIASDCALFGMEVSRRWKRPSGAAPTGIPPAALAPRAAAPKPMAPQPMPRPANGASAKIQRMPYAKPTGVAPKTGVVKRPAAVPPAAVMLRRRRSQRSLYLAAAASVLLLILLGWLLAGSSGPSPAPATDAAESTADAPARAAPAASDSAAAAPNSDSSVLDVVEELPRPGEESSPQDTRPAVVMRGTRAGEQLVRRVDPIYPAAARLNRIQGPVVLEASIGTHGFLRHIRVVSGDPLLAEAVLDAVKGWRYQPRTARGRAVETPTRIVVNFQLVARNSAPAR